MRFTDDDIDIPEKLLESLYKDELVIFVGAGLSYRTYPQQKPNTFYPLFSGLCEQIARELEIKSSDEEKELSNQQLYDRILGNWEYSGKRVREQTVEILTRNEEKQRLTKHRAVIDLFPLNLTPRIVTTNFDNLLTRALEERNLTNKELWKTFYSPALPPGRRFNGLCYLHGSVKEPDEMILTDLDIGKAYMDEGWALKFAYEVFKEFSVLFIGYRLNDPPLRYLSLALAGAIKRGEQNKINKWALVSMSDDAEKNRLDWNRRGVEPIFYPAKNDNHRSLEKVLIELGEYNKRGFVDRKNDLFELSNSDPNGSLHHQIDRIKGYLNDKDLLREFSNMDFSEGWFDRLVEWGHLDNILTGSGYNEADYGFSKWIISKIIFDHTTWILKLKKYQYSLHSTLLDTFCVEYQKNEEINIETKNLLIILEFFRPMIIKNESDRYASFLDRIFEQLLNSGYVDDAVWLLCSSIDVKLDLREHFGYFMAKIEGREDVELKLNCDLSFGGMVTDHLGEKYIKKHFLPRIETTGEKLLSGLTNEFVDIQKSVRRITPSTYTYIHRPSIEPDPKKNFSRPVENFFIDHLIIVWQKLLEVSPAQALNIFSLWKRIENPYFERLSLYCLTKLLEKGYVK